MTTKSSERLNLVVALLQAAVLWGLHQSIASGTWPATHPGGLAATCLVFVWVPPTLLVLWSHRHQRALWLASAGLAAFLAFAGHQAFDDLPAPFKPTDLDEDGTFGFIAPLVVGWLIFLPLLRARLEAGRWHPPYATLFRGTWRSFLTLAEALLFTGLFWVLLAIWAALFDVLGNPFFKELFSDPRFFYPATTLAFAVATRIIGGSDRLVDGVLDQILDLLKWLLPLAGLIVVAFTLALLPRLPALIGSGERVINSAVLLALVAATLLLLNAAYRDGETEPGYGVLLKQGLRVVPLLLTVVSATALYSLMVRTSGLGLTPARYWGLLTAVFALLFSAGYTHAALRSVPWLGGVRRVNFLLAVALLVTLAASLTPAGDPLRWSVASQLKRAFAAKSMEDREGALLFLRFDAGLQGRRALEALAGRGGESLALAERASVPADLQVAAARWLAERSRSRPPEADPSATPARYAAWRGTLRTVPDGREIPAGLEAALRGQFSVSASQLDPGGNAPAPVLFFTDLNADGVDDALLFAGTKRGDPQLVRDYRLFVVAEDTWRLVAKGSLD